MYSPGIVSRALRRPSKRGHLFEAYARLSTANDVQRALPYLYSSAHLFVDCEGRELGCEDGELTLISVGTVVARKIFLFDVLSLTRKDIDPVLRLLANWTTLKIVWDGRMDAVELQRKYGVHFGRVLDLQIADVVACAEHGDGDSDDDYQPIDPNGLYTLTALKYALRVHHIHGYRQLRFVDNICLLSTNMWRAGPQDNISVDHQQWTHRPLPAVYLEYAAQDISLLSRVYATFQSRRYVSTRRHSRPELEVQSRRYVNMWSAPVPNDSIYHHSNLLPLEKLVLPPAGKSSECAKWHRILSTTTFTYHSGGARDGHDVCMVCRVLTFRASAPLSDSPPSPSYEVLDLDTLSVLPARYRGNSHDDFDAYDDCDHDDDLPDDDDYYL